MASATIRSRALDVVVTPSLVENEKTTEQLVKELVRVLPPHFSFRGIEEIDSTRLTSPTSQSKTKKFMVVLGLTIFSFGKILEAFHEGEYERIIVFDPLIYDFGIEKQINSFINICSQRGLYRTGTNDAKELMGKMTSLFYLRNGSDLARAIMDFDAQLPSAPKRTLRLGEVLEQQGLLEDKDETQAKLIEEIMPDTNLVSKLNKKISSRGGSK